MAQKTRREPLTYVQSHRADPAVALKATFGLSDCPMPFPSEQLARSPNRVPTPHDASIGYCHEASTVQCDREDSAGEPRI